MIEIKDKSLCCGCNACGDVCPANAIRFEADEEGFLYPDVDKTICTGCGMCDKVCPVQAASNRKQIDPSEAISCFAVNHKNLEIRFDSTSGGMFSALAEEIYRKKGFVGGAIYNEDFSARHFISDDKADLARIRSSKYLQSDAQGFYRNVKDCCETGRPVLVCGTPCQISAMKLYLGKDYPNLTTVDFICHSVASPKAHRKYFDYLEEVFGSKAVYFKAKNKELGWRSLTKKTIFANGKSHYGVRGKDCYSRAYHSGMIDRPSCYSCKFKGIARDSDITLADFWGAEKYAKELDDNIGTSAVILHSDKGKSLFLSSSKRIIKKEVSIEDIAAGNRPLTAVAAIPNYDRVQFFKDMDDLRFDELSDKYFPVAAPSRRHPVLGTIYRIARQVINETNCNPRAIWQFVKLNFLHPAVHTDWRSNALIYPGANCVFDIDKTANVIVKGPVRFGVKRIKGSRLESRLLVDPKGTLEFLGQARFGYGSDVEVFRNAHLTFGADCGGNVALTVICGEKISIGSHTFWGREVSIRDTNGGHVIAMQGFKNTNPVIIGDFVWLCSECKIMTGVKIGDGTVVGSNSVVITPLPARVLVTGHPAQIIATDIAWKH